MANRWENNENSERLYFGGGPPKSLQMVIAAMKLRHLLLGRKAMTNLDSIRVYSNESALHIRWPKYWSFSISPSNEYSGLISLRINCFHLLAVQGTFKGLLQHHSSKPSILWQ